MEDNEKLTEQIASLTLSVGLLRQEITQMTKEMARMQQAMKHDFVTRQEFDPIQKIIYGLIGLILVTVMGALLALVVIR